MQPEIGPKRFLNSWWLLTTWALRAAVGFWKMVRGPVIGMTRTRAEISLSPTTVNGGDTVDGKHLSLIVSSFWHFYVGCAKHWPQSRTWGRAWLVNLKTSALEQKEGILIQPGAVCFYFVLSSVRTNNRTNSNNNRTIVVGEHDLNATGSCCFVWGILRWKL